MINKIFPNAYEALKDIKSGSSILLSGFGIVGITEHLSNVFSQMPAKDITLITNTPGMPGFGLGKHLDAKQIKRLYTTFFGGNKKLEQMYLTGDIETIFVPQGTLGERIRCGGLGIAGFYTRTGVDTLVETGGQIIKYKKGGKEGALFTESKPRKVFDGKAYIFEPAIIADYAFIKAYKADKKGNVQYRYSTRNFNQDMALSSKCVIVEAEQIVETGELHPDEIHTPGVFINRIVKARGLEKRCEKLVFNRGKFQIIDKNDETKRLRLLRERISRRAAKEFKNGMYCNLGIGMPTLIPKFLPENIKVMLHSENGILGLGDYPKPGQEDPDIINAGKETVTLLPGASIFETSQSFGIVRGAHLNMTCLGALEISSKGDIANWIIPGKKVTGMGGAMDLVGSGSQVMVLMEHTSKGKSKIVENCSLPLTGSNCVNKLVTDMGFFKFINGKITLNDIASGYTLEDLRNNTAAKFNVAEEIGTFE